jgi:carboxyl-terminal processing protease
MDSIPVKHDYPYIEDKNTKFTPPMTLRFIRNTALVLCALVIAAGLGWFVGNRGIRNISDVVAVAKQDNGAVKQTINRDQISNKNVDMALFWQVWDKLEANYLFDEKIDYQKMVYGAITGMTAALGDPYTAFFPPQENTASKQNLNGSFEGVGIQLGYKKDQIVVIAPISGMPAEKAGVKAGDYLIKIVDEAKGVTKETYNMNINDAVNYIRGEKDTKVKLTLLHEGASETYEVELARETIVVPSVEVEFGRVIGNQFVAGEAAATGSGKLVAHLKLSRFGELTDEQWDKSIQEILDKEKEIGGVVLDVRNNPGGYMQGAVNLAAEFLPSGKVIVKQESTQAPDQSFATQRIGRLLTTPLVVLMNKGSASASEILAGALSEHGRVKLVGDTSFGKGTIQTAEDLDKNGAGVHITIARWLTPNGNWVHEKGLTPDVSVALDAQQPTVDTQIVKAVETVLGR